MLPTFRAPGVDLYCGDSGVIIPGIDVTFDLLATDPPYGIEYQSGQRNDRFDVIHGDDGSVDVASILNACVLKLRKSRHVYVFGPPGPLMGIKQLTAHADLVWNKEFLGMGDLSLPWGSSHERINFAVSRWSKSDRESGRGGLSARLRQGTVLHARRANGSAVNRHPTEKPVSLMRQIIESSSCAGELVVDPFMGSGSTIVAALLSGRRAIGVEFDSKNFEIAKQRVVNLLPILDRINDI